MITQGRGGIYLSKKYYVSCPPKENENSIQKIIIKKALRPRDENKFPNKKPKTLLDKIMFGTTCQTKWNSVFASMVRPLISLLWIFFLIYIDKVIEFLGSMHK